MAGRLGHWPLHDVRLGGGERDARQSIHQGGAVIHLQQKYFTQSDTVTVIYSDTLVIAKDVIVPKLNCLQ